MSAGQVDVLAVLSWQLREAKNRRSRSVTGAALLAADVARISNALDAVAELIAAAGQVGDETGVQGINMPSIGATDRLRAALAQVQP